MIDFTFNPPLPPPKRRFMVSFSMKVDLAYPELTLIYYFLGPLYLNYHDGECRDM